MKKLLFSALAMCAIALNFVACSSDDDEQPQRVVTPVKMEAVDLGLPSGTKWCNMNVGAADTADVGHYYSWGEVKTKENYSRDYYKCDEIGTDISGSRYDAAFKTLGQNWVMPSKAQFDELIENCSWVWTAAYGVKNGYLVTGPNGNSIFLPAAGKYYGEELSYANEAGQYWTSSLLAEEPSHMAAWTFSFESGYKETYPTDRCNGMTVRPVWNPVQIKAVDLALPSGTKWCNMNVGSAKPQVSGEYFAWGETVSRDSFSAWESTDYSRFVADIVAKVGNDMGGTKYDAATKILGDSWRTPTKVQFEELVESCNWTWIAQNGIKGYTVTGSNNNSIFLPACGDWFLDNPRRAGAQGVYLISNIEGIDVSYFYFTEMMMDFNFDPRAIGRNIRAVYVEK